MDVDPAKYAQALAGVGFTLAEVAVAREALATAQAEVAALTGRACRACGCTDARGCPPDAAGRSCWWVAPDLCSRCAEADREAVDAGADLLYVGEVEIDNGGSAVADLRVERRDSDVQMVHLRLEMACVKLDLLLWRREAEALRDKLSETLATFPAETDEP